MKELIGSNYVYISYAAKLLSFLYLISLSHYGVSQVPITFEESFTAETTDQEKFAMYLDTIDKYLYRDLNITTYGIDECRKIIDQGTALSDSILFYYVIQEIYHKFNINESLGAYQLITENEVMLHSENISEDMRGRFRYLRSFTYMSIGDTEAAQKSFYEEIEIGKAQQDTATIISNLYSLGQLYSDAGEYMESINCYKQILEYDKVFVVRPTTIALTNIELAESYLQSEEFDKALAVLQTAQDIAEKNDLDILLSDVLMVKGIVFLGMKDIAAAESIYRKFEATNTGRLDPNNIINSNRLLAKLYRAKQMHSSALSVFKEILNDIDTLDLDSMLETYDNMHQTCKDMQDYESAYGYFAEYNTILIKKEEDDKRQQTEYLKIKYNSEQKEIENKILAAELNQNKTEKKVLYLSLALFFLLLSFLVAAYLQKQRYSKKLEDQVAKRTDKLKESNELLNNSIEELDEFNRILSHDLIEPLRSIISFSQLASRDLSDHDKVREYLSYVTKSGEQLSQLIEDVRLYREADLISEEIRTEVDIPTLFDAITTDLQAQFPNKKIEIRNNTDETISCAAKTVTNLFTIVLDNAVKYNTNESVKIKVDYSKQNDFYIFDIKDNGIGIDSKYHDQIFSMFKRLNNRLDYTGSGLGLSTAQKLAQKLGGDISLLYSDINSGTTFRVRLKA